MPVIRNSSGVARLSLLATYLREKSWVIRACSMAKVARTAPSRITQV